jgi:hypothetical protein
VKEKTRFYLRKDLIGCNYYQCGDCHAFFYYMVIGVAGMGYKSAKNVPKFCPSCGRASDAIVDFRLNFYDLTPSPVKNVIGPRSEVANIGLMENWKAQRPRRLPNRKAKRRR